MHAATPMEEKLSVGLTWPRVVAVALGAWLIVSAFLWRHTYAQMTNGVICGVLAIVVALAASRLPQARFVNTLVGIWVFVSAFLLAAGSLATAWNEIFVGAALVAVSIVPRSTRTLAHA